MELSGEAMNADDLKSEFPARWEAQSPVTQEWLAKKKRMQLPLSSALAEAAAQLADRTEKANRGKVETRQKAEVECKNLALVVEELRNELKWHGYTGKYNIG